MRASAMRAGASLLALLGCCGQGLGAQSPLRPEDALEAFYSNRVDHADGSNTDVYQQRFFVHDGAWGGPGAPIFFYTGNEADVELYVKATGLIWENAADFKACVIFAEHRYYGKSQVAGNEDLAYLSHEQALADFASLLYSFMGNRSAHESPVISFGGSYGGMLSTWFRAKYPTLVTGAIAGSAPIFAFPGDGMHFYDNGGNDYWQVVTRSAGRDCAEHVRPAFKELLSGRHSLASLQSSMRLCKKPRSALDVALWLANTFDTLAMGEFPFPSNYLSGDPKVFLPALPLRASCAAAIEAGTRDPVALAKAAAVFYNASGAAACFDVPSTAEEGDDRFSGRLWSYQWCSEMLPEEFYFSMTGEEDMFFPYNVPYSADADRKRCAQVWKTRRYDLKIREMYGSPHQILGTLSRVVFSNGLLDPWSSGGVKSLTAEQRARDLHVVLIPNGAHHVDLMFSHSDETPDITEARTKEVAIIRRWLAQHAEERAVQA